MISKYAKPLVLIIFSLLIVACNISRHGISEKNAPHERYRRGLEDAGLANTRLGQLWQAAANKSLSSPARVTVPYKETGYFEMEAPAAAGYMFSARRGEQLNIDVSTQPGNGFALFVELWEPIINDKPDLLSVADTIKKQIIHEVKKDGQYIVRIQPELLQGIAYTITITTAPSLAFPVNKKDEPRVISLWGVERDAGVRTHEGIDILAKKLTPAIAAADGRITNVSENNLGGKVVFMRPEGKDFNLYYAHLDSQLVRRGQSVKTGDTLGLIGNTGNARTTPAHLHFGIYASGGAVDPFPFVNMNRPFAKAVKADTGYVTKYARVKSNTVLHLEPAGKSSQSAILSSGSIVKVLAAADDFFKIQLPDQMEGFIGRALITTLPLTQKTFSQAIALLDMPGNDAAIKTAIEPGKTISLLGTWKDFYFAEWNNNKGWIKK
ncbi:MAG TPA: M23 family metallopeptidase [Chitinophagaceae bacterium]|nr:M23 family metallopeptidase [Chitinophagaceae bacterium]